MPASASFELLDPRIQRYLWSQGWASLRPAQEAAIPLVLGARQDIIVAAATAAGKTEAAFLPALTHLLQDAEHTLIVYVSPLKALINDQFGRLSQLCESLEIPVWPWHGDVAASVKKRFLERRAGVLLITPEALEATLCLRGSSVRALFEHTAYFVVDELHAFIGSERGKQLQSLLHRVDAEVGRPITRIGLSATLGDMALAKEFLRPSKGNQVALVNTPSDGTDLKALIKGFEEPLVPTRVHRASDSPAVADEEESELTSPAHIAEHLYKLLRGSNNLIFANSRSDVERYARLLDAICEREQVPREFWPHHGSLSREMRSETEAALKREDMPASAVCTNTLELGIDIGAVKCVAQVGPPPQVASLRQRLGRSGRRQGESAILRGYCTESALGGQSSLVDQLRLDTVQMSAMVTLLVAGWFEPPRTGGLHLSTLVQQLLAVIGQRSGATAGLLYARLCGPGAPFAGVQKSEFIALVRHLGEKDILVQAPSGELLHGALGERFFNHYTFYAAFSAQEEYRLVCEGKTLGTLPVSQALTIGQRLLFGGKPWVVTDVLEQQRTVQVVRSKGGAPPAFSGLSGSVHTRVRQEMRALLESTQELPFLDATAQRFLREARSAYRAHGLFERALLPTGRTVLLVTWMGDAGNEALACMLRAQGLTVVSTGAFVEVDDSSNEGWQTAAALRAIAARGVLPLEMLLQDVRNLEREKWDAWLPPALLRQSYASLHLDLDEAYAWASGVRARAIR